MTAIVLGTIAGMTVIYWAIAKVVKSQWRLRQPADCGKVARKATWITAVGTYPFVWLLSFLVGGNFGGAYASGSAERLGFPLEAMVSLGIGLGIFISISLLSIGLASLTFIIARRITSK